MKNGTFVPENHRTDAEDNHCYDPVQAWECGVISPILMHMFFI